MSIMIDDINPLSELRVRIDHAGTLTPDLFGDVIAQACLRHAVPHSDKRRRLGTLIEAKAWLDAALTLIEIELPLWSIRRLACDGGEWHCALTCQPNLPLEFDNTADAHHPVLPLAVLGAFLEARGRAIAQRPAPSVMARPEDMDARRICCENFC
jgi:hypothetical protein